MNCPFKVPALIKGPLKELQKSLQFKPIDSDKHFLLDSTPKALESEVLSSPSVIDYLMFQRNALSNFKIELLYHGKYGGRVNQRIPDEPNLRFNATSEFL